MAAASRKIYTIYLNTKVYVFLNATATYMFCENVIFQTAYDNTGRKYHFLGGVGCEFPFP